MPTPEHSTLTLRDGTPVSVALLGNTALLKNHKVAYLCSSRCAPDRILPAHDKARSLRDTGATVASAFQTPIELDACDILLRGKSPMIWCRPRGIETLKIQSPWRTAFDKGRVLILSFCPEAPPRTTRDQSLHTTRCLLRFAEETYIAHATPSGTLEKALRNFSLSPSTKQSTASPRFRSRALDQKHSARKPEES